MKKSVFYTELSYVFGMLILALGFAMMTYADFGLSMVVALAYLLHLKVSQYLPFFSFGTAEYTLQAVLLTAMCLVLRRFRLSYLFSFVTAVLYGFTLDGSLLLLSFIPADSMAVRIVYYVLGMVLCSVGVALFFRTYIAPEVYELFVKELAAKLGACIPTVKTIYDCASCGIAIVLSFVFFGLWHLEGVGWGTVVCALINGKLISWISAWLEKRFEFRDGKNWRKYFE